MPKRRSGFFITLEGPDGSGKSTQFKLLTERLKQAGYQVTETREPGGNPLAEKIRSLVLSCPQTPPTPEAELFLFLAARAQHVRHLILPALEQKHIVVCERFNDSTLAYQAGGRRLSESFVAAANGFASQNLQPDLTLLFDLSATQGLQRAFRAKRGHDRIESESISFMQRVRRAFLTLASREPKRIKVINADRPMEEVAQTVWKQVHAALPAQGLRKRATSVPPSSSSQPAR